MPISASPHCAHSHRPRRCNSLSSPKSPIFERRFSHTSATSSNATLTTPEIVSHNAKQRSLSLINHHRTPSLVDELLNEIYSRFPSNNNNNNSKSDDFTLNSTPPSSRRNSNDWNESRESDCMTEYSTTSATGANAGRRVHSNRDSARIRDSLRRRNKLQERGT